MTDEEKIALENLSEKLNDAFPDNVVIIVKASDGQTYGVGVPCSSKLAESPDEGGRQRYTISPANLDLISLLENLIKNNKQQMYS